MATIKSDGQSYLESQGMDARNEQMARSDYNQTDYYNEKHKDALADGDAQGKGTGDFGGHGFTVPDMTKSKYEMNYSNFNATDAGNDCDQTARKTMLARSLYSDERRYGVDIVPDTSANVSDGQYDGRLHAKIAYVCPVV